MSCNTGYYPNMPANNGMRGSMRRSPAHECGCGSAEPSSAVKILRDSLEGLPVAMAYVPWQHFARTYELDQAIRIGTIFPELNKPFAGKGGNCS